MTFEFSTLIWIFFILMILQPILMGRILAIRRADAIRKIEKALAQVNRGPVELMTPRVDKAKAQKIAEKLAGGHLEQVL